MAPLITDVATCGLDISDVKYVVNFDYPGSSEDYVHMTGRTARSGQSRTAYTFSTSKNFHKAAGLIKVLEVANQTVPPNLRAVENYHKSGRDRGRRVGGDRDSDRHSGGHRDRGDRPSTMNHSNAYGRGGDSSRRDDYRAKRTDLSTRLL